MITVKFNKDVDFDTIDFYMVDDDEQYEFIFKNGDKYYYKNRYLHNDLGPAIIEEENNNKEYWKKGKLSNIAGPAIINECEKVYAIDGRLTKGRLHTIIRSQPKSHQYKYENWDDGRFLSGVYSNGKVSNTPHLFDHSINLYTHEKQREKRIFTDEYLEKEKREKREKKEKRKEKEKIRKNNYILMKNISSLLDKMNLFDLC
jgi:RecG-like helicase